jgi:hypothetical protein
MTNAQNSAMMRLLGEMTEWLKVHAWKACVHENVPGVRIPFSPPARSYSFRGGFIYNINKPANQIELKSYSQD